MAASNAAAPHSALVSRRTEDKIEARFKNGVSGIGLPKSAKAQSHVKGMVTKNCWVNGLATYYYRPPSASACAKQRPEWFRRLLTAATWVA